MVPNTKAQESNVFGNPTLPDWQNITVTVAGDGKSFTVDNADNLTWTFWYGADKYNSIFQNGVQIVKDELWMLQFYDGSWKDIGSSVDVSHEQIQSYNVQVTQFYTSANGNYNVTWNFYGGFRPKISLIANISVAGNYTVDWRTYVYKDYAENKTNYVKFWNEDEEAIVFDYTDVYESFGNITEADVSGWTKGKRFDEIFNVGFLDVGLFRLDPNFGYESKGNSYTQYADYIMGSPYTCPEDGTAISITAYCKMTSSGKKKFALYKVSDDSLVGYTEEHEGTWIEGWHTLDIVWGGTLASATDYYIVLWAGTANLMFWYQDLDISGCYDAQSYNGFPDPFDPTSWSQHKVSIYCTYSTDWLYISSTEYDSHCGDDGSETIEEALDGTDAWTHEVDEDHWFILDLGETYTITEIRGRSNSNDDPTLVDVYVSDSKVSWGTAVAIDISIWQDTNDWQEVDSTDKDGRYVKVVITDTEDPSRDIRWGPPVSGFKIFDVYGEVAAGGENYLADVSQAVSSSWSMLAASNFNVNPSQALTTTGQTLANWNAQTDLTQTLATTYTSLVQWNALTDLTQSLTTAYTSLVTWTASTTLAQTLSISEAVLVEWTADAILGQALGTSWLTLTEWNAITDLTQGLSTSWTVLIDSTFNVATSITNTFSWIVDVVHTVGGGIAHIADLTQSISTSWTALIESTFNVATALTVTSTWISSISSTFNTANTLTITSSWIVDAITGTQHAVDLTISITTSWLVDVAHSVGVEITVEVASVTASFAIIALAIALCALVFAIKKRKVLRGGNDLEGVEEW